MGFDEIVSLLEEAVESDAIVAVDSASIQPFIEVRSEALPEICRFLFNNENLYFDYLACITGIDNGPEKATMEVIYNLNSIPFGHNLMIKAKVVRNTASGELPVVPTVSDIWRTADWHEREIFDLLGIRFEGHPDLRRILLPEDWVGYPLRKDYQVQEYYHGIRVRYEDRDDPGANS